MPVITDSLAHGLIGRGLPITQPDGSEKELRVSRYGDQYVQSLVPTKHLLAEEGGYFVSGSSVSRITAAGLPSPGTGVAQQGQITSFSATAPLWSLFNAAPTGGKRIYLDYLRLCLMGTAPTATVSLELAVMTDTVNKTPTATNQYSYYPPTNVNSDDNTQSNLQVLGFLSAQAFTVSTYGSAARLVARGRVPTGLGITGDEYIFQFGANDRSSASATTATRSTCPARLIGDCPPVIIGPQIWATLHLWWLTSATNVPAWDWEIGYWER